MPARINSTSPSESKVKSFDETEEMDQKVNSLDKTSSTELSEIDDIETNSLSVNQQTATETINSSIQNNTAQPQSATTKSFGTLPYNVPSVPGNTIPPGQQQPVSYHYPAPVVYQPSLISGEGGSVMIKDGSYPVNYDIPPPMVNPTLHSWGGGHCYQYGWQYQLPSVISSQQQQQLQYHHEQYFPMYGYCPQFSGFNSVSALSGNGYTPEEPSQPHPPLLPLPTPVPFPSSSSAVRNRINIDSCNHSPMNVKGQEYPYNCCQLRQPGWIPTATKESRKYSSRLELPSTNRTTDDASASSTGIKNNAKVTIDESPRRKQQRLTKPFENQRTKSSTTTATLRPEDGAADTKWYYRETHLSSDSGCISDNSSNRDEAEVSCNDLTCVSPTVNEISDQFRDGMQLESSGQQHVDEVYEKRSSVSSMSFVANSDGDGSERQAIPVPKHSQQTRLMKPIPSRFMSLLVAAAENAAAQRKRLEGYPIFRYPSTCQLRGNNFDAQLQVTPEIPRSEYPGVINQQHQGIVWLFPNEYVQYHPTPEGYVQGYGPGSQGGHDMYLQGSATYPQGQELSSPRSYFQYIQQGNTCYLSSLQGTGSKTPFHYSDGNNNSSASVSYNEQQNFQEFCAPSYVVPTYIIQVDNPDLVNQQGAVHENGYNTYCIPVPAEKQPSSISNFSGANNHLNQIST